MWLLFHRKAGTRVVDGGATFKEHCPSCQKQTKFEEVEVSESVGVWFIDVAGDKQRKFRCRACGDVFELRDVPDEKPAPTTREVDSQMRRDARKAIDSTKIEDELAALKKKMGR